jgi:hypothetical protein
MWPIIERRRARRASRFHIAECKELTLKGRMPGSGETPFPPSLAAAGMNPCGRSAAPWKGGAWLARRDGAQVRIRFPVIHLRRREPLWVAFSEGRQATSVLVRCGKRLPLVSVEPGVQNRPGIYTAHGQCRLVSDRVRPFSRSGRTLLALAAEVFFSAECRVSPMAGLGWRRTALFRCDDTPWLPISIAWSDPFRFTER